MPHINIEERRTYYAEYRKRNRETISEYSRSYVERNPEARKLSVDKANKSASASASKAAYRERNREKLREAARKYVKDNRAISAENLARYRATKRMATPPWADIKAIRKFYIDARQRSKETGIEHHVDHMVPLVSTEVCGLHVQFNLQVITGTENRVKSNRIFERTM